LAFADAAVRGGGRVEVAAGAAAVRGAAIAVLVDVEAVLAAGRQAGDLAGDADAAVDDGEFQAAGDLVALGRGERGAGRGRDHVVHFARGRGVGGLHARR